MSSTSSTGEQPRLFDIAPYARQPDRGDRDLGHVYAVLMPSHAIKIGFTRDLHRRVLELGSRYGARLLTACGGSAADEARYHHQLASYRIGRTEDFWPSPAVWVVVENITRAAQCEARPGEAPSIVACTGEGAA